MVTSRTRRFLLSDTNHGRVRTQMTVKYFVADVLRAVFLKNLFTLAEIQSGRVKTGRVKN